MNYVYTVNVCREGDSGADMLPIGTYADEFTARIVARNYEAWEDEWVTVNVNPVLTQPVTEINSGHEGWQAYSRYGDKPLCAS